jgi:hypothetical protein
MTYNFSTLINASALVQYNDRTRRWSTNLRFNWLRTAATGLYSRLQRHRTVQRSGPVSRAFVIKFSHMLDCAELNSQLFTGSFRWLALQRACRARFLIAFVARVLVQARVALLQPNERRPRLRPHRRVVDSYLVVDAVGRDACEAFDEMQVVGAIP